MRRPTGPTIPTDSPDGAGPVVRARQLVKRFRSAAGAVPVFDGLDLELAPGESLALMGRSGSGKSTLLNLLCGLEPLDAGELSLFGQNGGALSAEAWSGLRRAHIATVFQEANLMPAMTLAENVRLRAQLAGQASVDAAGWLARLGLDGLGDRYPDQVSGGQRQRAALVMAFAMQPKLLLADEPTGSLDRHTADDVADVLFDFQHEQRCPMILATHDPALAERCDRVLRLGAEA
ncbi:ABC transporter ATP-binding protein [Marinobacter sp. JSM 1782161]|uniref:ABC transporter ATP-binding protein n=1 Tax=Marinobacter sp. JSM 1782161 TaxID=2685906 RepID=UPI001403FCDF|nr:ABC transporter ATP-binding protein [Marinobacter sp. JSM 1782161]